jgi:hypothetical protein
MTAEHGSAPADHSRPDDTYRGSLKALACLPGVFFAGGANPAMPAPWGGLDPMPSRGMVRLDGHILAGDP